jgi:hypothetical protein
MDSKSRMDFDQLKVANFRAYGEKIKAWAKGTDPLPATIEEFAAQLAAAEAGATIPARYKVIKFHQSDERTLAIKLPPKAVLEAKEAVFREQKGTYPLPAFYERVFEAQPKIDDMLSFQAERIGEYSVAHCG